LCRQARGGCQSPDQRHEQHGNYNPQETRSMHDSLPWKTAGNAENAYQNLILTRNGLRISGLEFGFDSDSDSTAQGRWFVYRTPIRKDSARNRKRVNRLLRTANSQNLVS
jgi:hypothetical protein